MLPCKYKERIRMLNLVKIVSVIVLVIGVGFLAYFFATIETTVHTDGKLYIDGKHVSSDSETMYRNKDGIEITLPF